MSESLFYRVGHSPYDAPLDDYLTHGYENWRDFYNAVRRLTDRWHDRIGECIGERNGFLLLCFHDTPGGIPDEGWLPGYLLTAVEAPRAIRKSDSSDETEGEINRAFGFE